MSTCSSVDSKTLSRMVEIFADSERSAAILSTSNWIPPAPGTPIALPERGDFALRLNRVNLAIQGGLLQTKQTEEVFQSADFSWIDRTIRSRHLHKEVPNTFANVAGHSVDLLP